MKVKRGGGRLPAEYQEVEWIGNQNTTKNKGSTIDTGIGASLGLSVICKMQRAATSAFDYNGYPALFGTLAPKLLMSIRTVLTKAYMTYGNSGEKSSDLDANSFHEISISKTEWAIDGVTKASYNVTAMDSASSTIHIFGRGEAGGGYSNDCAAKCAFFKISDAGGALIFDGVPCYRKADGEIGMFDLVSKTFLTNAGAGTFTKGADVN